VFEDTVKVWPEVEIVSVAPREDVRVTVLPVTAFPYWSSSVTVIVLVPTPAVTVDKEATLVDTVELTTVGDTVNAEEHPDVNPDAEAPR